MRVGIFSKIDTGMSALSLRLWFFCRPNNCIFLFSRCLLVVAVCVIFLLGDRRDLKDIWFLALVNVSSK